MIPDGDTTQLVIAVWGAIAACLGTATACGIAWANTKRDAREALEDVAHFRTELAEVSGKIAGLELSIQREMQALEVRIVALETRQADILQAVLYIKENMLLKAKSHYGRSSKRED